MSPQPPACAGAGQFASLPVDQDCNGIADSWEEAKAGKHYPLDPAANTDDENSPGGYSDRAGDGFTALEEYRGFHHVTDDWNEGENDKIRWTDTDPANTRDVFFWDSTPDSRFTKAIQQYLTSPSGALVNSTPNILARAAPGIKYWRVSAEQAHAADPAGPSGGTKRFNVNSSSTKNAFAAAYVDLPYPVESGQKPCWGDRSALAVSYTGHGAMLFTVDTIRECATKYGSVFVPDLLLAWTVAHETAHRFGLDHYSRDAQYINAPPELVQRNQYTVGQPPTHLQTRFQVYQVPGVVPPVLGGAAPWVFSDTLQRFVDGGDPEYYPIGSVPAASENDHAVRTVMNDPVSATATIKILESRDKIMDYFPRFVRIPTMSITHSDLMPIRSERSDAGPSQCEALIGIRQDFCGFRRS